MTERRIYFEKFDELEEMLGLKPVEISSRTRRAANRVVGTGRTLLTLVRRDGTRTAEATQAPTPVSRAVDEGT